MIAAAIAVILLAILIGFFILPYGFIVSGVALLLLIVFLVAVGRQAHEIAGEQTRSDSQ